MDRCGPSQSAPAPRFTPSVSFLRGLVVGALIAGLQLAAAHVSLEYQKYSFHGSAVLALAVPVTLRPLVAEAGSEDHRVDPRRPAHADRHARASARRRRRAPRPLTAQAGGTFRWRAARSIRAVLIIALAGLGAGALISILTVLAEHY